MLIDMDRISMGNPIIDVAGIYMFYVAKGERDPKVVEDYMGFSYDTAKRFWKAFIRSYMGTDDESVLAAAEDKAALVSYVRLIRQIRRKGTDSEEYREDVPRLLGKIKSLSLKLTSLQLND